VTTRSIHSSGHILTARYAAVRSFTANLRDNIKPIILPRTIKRMSKPISTKQACPCHSGLTYANCCAPIHQGQPALSAENLMRSRYSAYALKMPDYLLASWHASTRPNTLTQADLQGLEWLGLVVLASNQPDSQHATVTFKARFKAGKDKTQTLHETSQFVMEHGHWFYVDGDILQS
jgi:SEC-C motif domain protein